MKRLMVVVIALVVIAAGLWGCTGSQATVAPSYEATPRASEARGGAELGGGPSMPSPTGEGPAATPSPTPPDEEEAMTPQPAQGTPEANCPTEARNVVLVSKDDLARRLGLSVSEISVISVEAVDWPDASLGCPQPGMAYAQVITRGFLVVLEAAGQSYEYHTDRGMVAVPCDEDGYSATGEASAPSTTTPSHRLPTIIMRELLEPPYPTNVESLIEKARQDLGSRLGILSGEIDVVRVEMAEWPDTRLGCGEPGLARLPVAIPGYRVVLSARNWEYVYHTDRESGVVYCPKG